MAPRSKVTRLPAPVKQWLDDRLVEGNFSGYELLSAELAKRGYAISKTALHNYGQEFEDRLSAVKLSTEQARAVVAAAPDEDNSVNDALIRLVQERIFTLLVDLNSGKMDPTALAKITKAVADLGRTSISQRRFMAEVRAKVAETAKKVEAACREAGVKPETLHAITQDIYGIGA